MEENDEVVYLTGVKFTNCAFCLVEAQPNIEFRFFGNSDKTCQMHLDLCSGGQFCICCGVDRKYVHSDVGIGYENIECSKCHLSYETNYRKEWTEEMGLPWPDDFNAIYDEPVYAEGWYSRVFRPGVRKLSSEKS